MKIGYLFPGQGSQVVGMGRALYQASPSARRRFAQATEVLGYDLAQLMMEGPEEELRKTIHTQPAIYLHSLALAEALQVQHNASAAAGHSLGEFSALAAMGALSFEEGLQLVALRAGAMQRACNLAPSTMAAIVGLEDAAVEAFCKEVGDVVPANYNSPGQLVISGSKQGIAAAIELAKAKGAKLAKELNVSGAFHSPFMEPARVELAKAINQARISPPVCPIYQNVDGLPQTDPEQIRERLIQQLTSAVRWTETLLHMAPQVEKWVEVGPGKVLQGLAKRITPQLAAESMDTVPED